MKLWYVNAYRKMFQNLLCAGYKIVKQLHLNFQLNTESTSFHEKQRKTYIFYFYKNVKLIKRGGFLQKTIRAYWLKPTVLETNGFLSEPPPTHLETVDSVHGVSAIPFCIVFPPCKVSNPTLATTSLAGRLSNHEQMPHQPSGIWETIHAWFVSQIPEGWCGICSWFHWQVIKGKLSQLILFYLKL